MERISREDFLHGYPPEQVFATSDLHLYHTNIIKYCNRPFEYSQQGCAEMNEFILRKFDLLPEDGMLWIFGDVFLSWNLDDAVIMNDIQRMKKNHVMNLILGNHDYKMRKKPFPTCVAYFEHLGFDKVYVGPLLFENLVLSHVPVFLDAKQPRVNLHGHTHEKMVGEDYFLGEYCKSSPKKKVNPVQYKNVCMDANGFQILRLADFL
ncbi:MAG: metallophosphoesterase [Treponema sp.]|nr:metallophosphoesterase [Treponema sp.]